MSRYDYTCETCGGLVALTRGRTTCTCSHEAPAGATWAAAFTTDAMYASRARFNARLAARACCRAHGTTCPDCRAADHSAPRWRVRLRDLRDLLLAWWQHG